MAPLIKNPYDLNKVLTFKWHVSKFEPNWIISFQINCYLSEATVANFQNNEKSEFPVLIKYCFLMGKILFKQSNGLISVIWTLLHRKQWLRGGMLTLNAVVQTRVMLNAQVAQFGSCHGKH